MYIVWFMFICVLFAAATKFNVQFSPNGFRCLGFSTLHFSYYLYMTCTSTFNMLSWNVRGLNSLVMRTRCLELLRRRDVSIALLQETHLKDGNVHRFQNKYYKMLACSCALNKSKGVLILYKRSLSLSVDSMGKDDCGRFLMQPLELIIPKSS